MTDTNVNTGGQGAPNWNVSAGAQPRLDPATGQPIPNQVGPDQGMGTGTADVEANVQTEAVEELTQDTVTVSSQTDASLYVVGNRAGTTVYTASSAHPSLPQSLVNNPQAATQTLQSTINPPKEFIQQTVSNLVNLLPNGVDTDLSPEELQAVVTDDKILELAAETGVSPQVILKNVQTEKNNAFQELVNKLPPDQANKLTFAYYVPEGAKNLSPELKTLLQQLNGQANQEVAENFKFGSDWPGVEINSAGFRSQLSQTVDAEFTKLLNAKIDEGGLSASDAAMLRAMHNGMATGTPTLKNLLQQLQTQATAQLQAKYGIDVSYQPKGDVAAYNNIVNGDFAQTYQKAIAKYTGTATAEQKALLEKFAANPKDPSIPDNIKQLAKQLADERQLLLQAFPNPDKATIPDALKATAKALIAESISVVVAKYNLDPQWQPTIKTLASPFIDPATMKKATSAMDLATEVFDRAQAFVNGMPESPEKTMYLQYLKIIGRALITIQEAIYGMQATQTKVSTALNRAQLESQLNDIAQQEAAAAEARKKESKMAKMGPLANVMNWIMKIAIIAFGALAGPIGVAIAIAYVTDSIVSEAQGKETTMVQDMFAEIANSMPAGAATVVKALLVTVLSMISLNPLVALNLITQDSKVMETFAKACGADPTEQMWAGLIFSIVVQVAFAFALIYATGGAATAATMSTVIQHVATTFEISTKLATQIVKSSIMAVKVIMASLQIASSGMKLNNALIARELDMIKAKAEAYSEQVQALIAILKKLIQKLLALLEGNADMLVNINTLQGKKWSDASDQTSMIFG